MLERLASPLVAPAASAGPTARRLSPFALFLVASALLPLALFAFAALQDWRALTQETRARVGFARDAIAEHALRVFKTHELAAARLADRLLAADPAAVPALLAEAGALLPEVSALAVVDLAGAVTASRGTLPRAGGALLDEALMRDLGAGAPLVVGGREGGIEAPFLVAVPRRDPSGGLEGAIVLAVPPESFRRFYRETFPTRGSVGLIHRDGAVLVRAPEKPGDLLTMLPSSPFFGLIGRASRDVTRVETAVTGRTIELGYAQVGSLPIYAFYAVAQEDLEAAWWTRFSRTSLYFAPAAALLAALAFFAWRSHGRLEATVQMRTRALSAALDERELLLREVHHRVKNNMQIISSMIRLQDRVGTEPTETVRRIQAMAMVHELVYATAGPVTEIDLAAYAERLCGALEGDGRYGVCFDLDLEPIRIDLERAIPFALILSEAATNAWRHAYPEGSGRIEVTLRRRGERVELRVHDAGLGFNPEVDGRGGFGLKLIRSLSVQLGAIHAFERGGGTRFSLIFPLAASSGGPARGGA